MYDYKFRQSDLPINKPKRTPRRAALGISGLIIAAAFVYGIAQLDRPWDAQTKTPEAGSEIIPLALPPHSESEDSTRPADSDPNNQGKTD